jgi:hypothetical protein
MKRAPYVSYEEMVQLGYFTPPKLTKWQKIKGWFKSFFTYGDFTGLGTI